MPDDSFADYLFSVACPMTEEEERVIAERRARIRAQREYFKERREQRRADEENRVVAKQRAAEERAERKLQVPKFGSHHERNLWIEAQVAAGRSLHEVALDVGVSYERVRQILSKLDAMHRESWRMAREVGKNRTPGQTIDALLRNRHVLDLLAHLGTPKQEARE